MNKYQVKSYDEVTTCVESKKLKVKSFAKGITDGKSKKINN